jgi:GTPase
MFVDEIIVELAAGRGGDGCVSFRREKFIPKGGPDGGDGGSGGSIVLKCDENVDDLTAYYYKSKWVAKNGEKGGGVQCSGASAKDVVLLVPAGTIVFEAESGIKVAELTAQDQTVKLLKGGKGGLGNVHFKSSTHQSPREFTKGEEGESGTFNFELRTIADVGLVGFPNAGKSTLVNNLTSARRKTAPYPFTTLHPSVGVIFYPEHYGRIRLADIPGLIAGASLNKGLGHRFLKHIDRCKILVLIIDMAGTDNRDPLADYTVLLKELEQYDPALLQKNRIVAANKIDEPIAVENLEKFRKQYKDVSVYPISAVLGEGLPDLKRALWDSCGVPAF